MLKPTAGSAPYCSQKGTHTESSQAAAGYSNATAPRSSDRLRWPSPSASSCANIELSCDTSSTLISTCSSPSLFALGVSSPSPSTPSPNFPARPLRSPPTSPTNSPPGMTSKTSPARPPAKFPALQSHSICHKSTTLVPARGRNAARVGEHILVGS